MPPDQVIQLRGTACLGGYVVLTGLFKITFQGVGQDGI